MRYLYAYAVAENLIDPKTANPADTRWQQSVWLTLGLLAARLDRDTTVFFASLTAHHPKLTKETFECYDVYTESLMPWRPAKKRDQRTDMAKAEAAWAEVFGDPDSPEVQANIARTVAFLQRKGS